MKADNNLQAFFALVRAGLWEQEVRLSQFEEIDFNEVYRLAEEQSVIGLVAAGIGHVQDIKVPQEVALTFWGYALQIEQRNRDMNSFINKLMMKLRIANIYSLLVKGQGIAQCYEKPLWRTCGDVDLLLNVDDYQKAKELLIPLSDDVETEYTFFKHIGMTIKGWVVELHGTLHSRLSKKIDQELDTIRDLVVNSGDTRVWSNDGTDVYLPAPDSDVIFVFTHFLHHFFFEGVGMRQICDWCRLLWTFRDKIDVALLEKRLRKMELMTEWEAFAAYAVEYLGMPQMAMPLYVDAKKWNKKANKIQAFLIEVGNFGHNIDGSYYSNYPYLIRKTYSMFRRVGALGRHACIFPFQVVRYLPHVVFMGLKTAIKGE